MQNSIHAFALCFLVAACASPADHRAASGESAATEHEKSAAKAKIEADLTGLGSAIKHYQMNNGGEAPETLEVLVISDANGKRYFREAALPLDPYAQPYAYTVDANLAFGWGLRCLGSDHAPGGTGQDADTVFGLTALGD